MNRLHTLGLLALIFIVALIFISPAPEDDEPVRVTFSTESPSYVPIDATYAPLSAPPEELPPLVLEAVVEPTPGALEAYDTEEPRYTKHELVMVAQTVHGEAVGCSLAEQRAVVWTVFQRVDAGGDFRNQTTITAVLTHPNAFAGYNSNHPVDPDIYAMVCEEAEKWANGEEPPIVEPYAPSLPYLFFDGRRGEDGLMHNYFREVWK